MSNIDDKSMIEAICQAAIFEQSIIDRGAEKKERWKTKWKEKYPGGVSENTLIQPGHYNHIIHLDEEYITPATFQACDPKVRATFGKYMLIYLLAQDRRAKNGKRFMVCQDLIRTNLLYKDINEFYQVAKCSPEVRWLSRNTTLTRELFLLAMRHPGMAFVFTIKHVEYANMLEEKAKAAGIDTYKNPPFVAIPCGYEKWEKEFKDLKMSPERTWRDYQKDLKDLKPEGEEQDGKE